MSTENQPEWEKEIDSREWIRLKLGDQDAEVIKVLFREFAFTLLDEFQLEKKESCRTCHSCWKEHGNYCRECFNVSCEHQGYNQAKQEVDQQKEAIRKKYGL